MATKEDKGSFATLLAPGAPVIELARAFNDAGHDLYLVGGAVRDMLLRRSPGLDIDLATDARPEETLELVRPASSTQWLQGMRFGTVGAAVNGLRIEITTFRSDEYQPGSRHPEVTFGSSIETDLSRRDFTINAMAVRLPDKDALDPFDGVADLKARVLRTPIDPDVSFTDDPLRMLRAFRFVSQLDFSIAPETLESIERKRDALRTISAERIADELGKLLVGNSPGRALELADRVGLTDIFLPEMPGLKLEQDPVHRHKDVFHHTLAVIDRTQPQDLELRLAAMLHDIGKPKTRKIGPEGVSFHHHEIVGARMADERLRELRFANHVVDNVRTLIELHHRFHTYRLGWTDAAVRRYARDAGPLLDKLNALVRADCTTRNEVKAKRLAARMDELEDRIKELAAREELDKLRPELDGDQIMAYLGIEPGPMVGQARDFMMELRLDDGIVGEDEAYRRLDEWARARGIEPAGTRVPPRKKKDADTAG